MCDRKSYSCNKYKDQGNNLVTVVSDITNPSGILLGKILRCSNYHKQL